VTSFAFRADGSIMAARARISSGGSSGDIQQFFSGFETTARTSYSMKNGEWQCTGANYTSCGPIQDRAITGFSRTSDYTSTSSSVYADGPDCGKSCIDPNHTDWGNRCRACGATGNMHWRKIYR
jgi:hypothetical protein